MFVEYIGFEYEKIGDDIIKNNLHLTIGKRYEVFNSYTYGTRNLTIISIIDDLNISCNVNFIYFEDVTKEIERDRKISNILHK